MMLIYEIRNLINNKFYIGSAIKYQHRWACHESDLNLNKHKNNHLQHAWNKYGAENFEFRAIEAVENKGDLLKREQYWIDLLKPEYNVYRIAGSPVGTKHSAASRANMSKAHLGYKHTEEQKRKIGLAHKGRILSDKAKENLKKYHGLLAKINRKVDKWPCLNGIKCQCEECKNKRREYGKLWARRKKAKMLINV